MNFENIVSLPPIWDTLRRETRPILLYGTGNGADKILDVMERRKIPCAGVFASDGFVRNREFRGMPVLSYSDALRRFGEDIVILVAFGSPRGEVLDFVDTLSRRHTLFIPDVPLFCDDLEKELFTPEYAQGHREQILCAAELFDDEESRELYYETLAYRITGESAYLRRTEPFERSLRDCLPQDVENIIDGGAFTGDTAREFLAAFPSVGSVVCVEPDERSFRRLFAFAESDSRVSAVNAALGESDGTNEFRASGSRASASFVQNRRQKTVAVRRVTVDGVARSHGIFDSSGRSLLKLDVEGSENAAIAGAREFIAERRPALAVALYHRTEDIFALPAAIAGINPGYRFRLRRARCIPAWELTLFGY